MTDSPTIRLGGKDVPVPELAIRQLRVVLPGLAALRRVSLDTISAEEIDTMSDVILAAVQRSQPDVTKDQFLDWPMSVMEMIQALPVIAAQSGMATSKDAPSGEASPSIGTT